MPVLAVAAIPTVASFLMRMGATKAAKKYAPKLLKQARAYIKNEFCITKIINSYHQQIANPI